MRAKEGEKFKQESDAVSKICLQKFPKSVVLADHFSTKNRKACLSNLVLLQSRKFGPVASASDCSGQRSSSGVTSR